MSTPVLAVAATFVSVSNLLGSIRKKDDEFNWFAGGVSSGIILGKYFKSPRTGFVSSVLFGFGLMGIKVAHLNNYSIRNEYGSIIPEGGATAHKYDFTLTKERPKNWTTGN